MSTEAQQPQQTPPPLPTLSLDILKRLHSARFLNGIKHSDYLRYRNYCTKRLKKLRDTLNFHHGKKYQKKRITPEIIKDSRYFQLVLVSAERAWSFAMHLKVEASKNRITVQQPRSHFHMLRRLRKAVIHSRILLSLTTARADSRTSLEAEAYNCWLEGNLLLEQEKWQTSLEKLVRASTIYENLALIQGDDDHKEIIKARLQELEPGIRFCKYNLRGEAGEDSNSIIELIMQSKDEILAPKLQHLLEESRKKQIKNVEELKWGTKTLYVKNEKLHAEILKIDDARNQLNKQDTHDAQIAAYDQLFFTYNNCLKLARDDVTAIEKSKESGLENAQGILNYLNYHKNSYTLQRNQLLATAYIKNLYQETTKKVRGEKNRPQDLVKIYENMMQNVTDMDNLRDKSDTELGKSLSAALLTYKALRCYFVALSYSFSCKWKEALALLNRTTQHIEAANEKHKACVVPDKSLLEKLVKLTESVSSERSMITARHILEEQKSEVAKGTGNLLTNPSVYDPSVVDTKKTVDIPLDYKPMFCKPLLFDVALTGCQFPSLESRIQVKGSWFSSLKIW